MNVCSKDGTPNCQFDCKDCQDFVSHTKGLKHCPFCGGKAYLDKTYELKDEWEVFCQKCLVSMKKRGLKKVVDAWNSRKPL
jgi:Lar family restriction alleviation protein